MKASNISLQRIAALAAAIADYAKANASSNGKTADMIRKDISGLALALSRYAEGDCKGAYAAAFMLDTEPREHIPHDVWVEINPRAA